MHRGIHLHMVERARRSDELSGMKARFDYDEASADVAAVEFFLNLLSHVGPPEPIVEETTEDSLTPEVAEGVSFLDELGAFCVGGGTALTVLE